MNGEGLFLATITRRDGPTYEVQVGDAEVSCCLRGRLRRAERRVSATLVVGDRVQVQLQADGSGVIEAIEPRRTELARPGFARLEHVIAANLEQLVIVQAAAQPRFKRHLAERFIATARRGGMEPVVVVNKCDLVDEREIRAWVAPLAAAEVPVLLTSTVDGRGIDELRDRLVGSSSVLAGQSGVGKSSLLNAVFPGFAARIGAVSGALNKGRHTTTASRLYPLPGGGWLADTPGIRTLGLFEDDGDAIEEAFPEIERAAARCRFRDCSHSHETRCAVKEEVERGAIDLDRYEHFLRLAAGG